jgi:hypothetical protein
MAVVIAYAGEIAVTVINPPIKIFNNRLSINDPNYIVKKNTYKIYSLFFRKNSNNK